MLEYLANEREYAEYKIRTLADAAALRELVHTELWQKFYHRGMQLLEECRARAMTGTKEEFDYNKGLYEGTRRLLNLPVDVAEEAERIKREEKESVNFESRRPGKRG